MEAVRRHRRPYYHYYFILYIFLSLLPILTSGSNDYDDDLYPQHPRIVTKHGHLLFVAGNGRNITFQSKGSGRVRVNDEDLGDILISAKRSVAELQLIKDDELVTMRQNIRQVQTRVNDLTQLETRVSDVENSVRQQIRGQINSTQLNSIRTRQNQMTRRLNQMKTRIDNLVTLLERDECESNPCQNGATCHDNYKKFSCTCPTNWEGPTCSADVNECSRYIGTTMGCQNGATCINTYGGFSCQCPADWYGVHCTERHDDCSSSSHQALCGHGTCINRQRTSQGQPSYTCICDEGWTTAGGGSVACNVDVDECSPNRRSSCSTNPPVRCVNLPGTFTCGSCPNGYSGNGFVCEDINECQWNNGGCSMTPMVQCINTLGSRQCGACPAGYQGNGESCMYVGICRVDNGGCHGLATCIENPAISINYRECRCPAGYQGSGVGATGCIPTGGTGGSTSIVPTGDPCNPNRCNRGTCVALSTTSYRCNCPLGFNGQHCEVDINECLSQPCQNGGTCVDQTNGYHCNCPQTHTGSNCEEMRDNCGGFLNGDNGTLVYPLEQQAQYPHNRSCAWLITTPQTEKVLNLTFVRFSLEASRDCHYDFLQINDGNSAAAHPLGRFCGSTPPRGGSILTTHNTAYLWFYSDSTVSTEGFTIRWNTVDPVCGNQSSEIKEHGTIKSPGYPGRYPLDRDCVWFITVRPGKKIQFAFATLQLEDHSNCEYDFLQIRDGLRENDPVLATYCSTTTPPPLQTSGSNARLYFHSDHSNNDVGFLITYTSVPGIPGCGGLLTGVRGSFSSPDHPNNYDHGIECDWLIRVHPNERVRLVFTAFTIEQSNNCQWDYIQIFDGSDDTAPTFGRVCGRILPQPVISTSNNLFVQFKTDASVTMAGFRATYEIICGGIYEGNAGLVHSPNYPDPYPGSRECFYLIRASPGKAINLWFEFFDVEDNSVCYYDYLEIRDGDTSTSPLLGHFCGTDRPEPIISTYNVMWMKFKTDSSIHNRGFLANFTVIDIGCGGIYHNETTGVINSPNHPEQYLHNVSCQWIIRPQPGHVVQLTFNVFALESHWQCRFDYLAVYDNVTSEDPQRQMGKFCGQARPPVLTSTDNLIFIVFKSDHSVAREGFSISFNNLDASSMCGGNYFTSLGVIRSPNYPRNYRHTSHCTWTIKVEAGKQVELKINSFQLEDHPNCNYDYLEIRNGGHMTSPLIGRYCGTSIPRVIPSHSNQMWLQFVSDQSQSAPGFNISWDGSLTGCGGDLIASEGTFSSPNYPMRCMAGIKCQWRITVNRGNRVRMILTDLDTATTRNCAKGLKIYNGRSNRSPLLGSFCGTHIPDPITSPSNEVFVEFECQYGYSNQRGFQLSYNTACNGITLKGRRGVIQTPNFPQPYPHNRNCSWTIDALTGNTINISFLIVRLEHSNNCRYDYVQLTNLVNGTDIGKYCSSINAPPNIIATNTSRVGINFLSDYSYADNGFSLEWMTSGCGGNLRKPEGTFSTPNYPHHYAPGITCEWDIQVSMGHGIELTIQEYDLESSGVDCVTDSIKIYSGADASGILLNTLCERRVSPLITTSTGNRMHVRFTSNNQRSGRGFTASYVTRREGCGGLISGSRGVIHSRNFPNQYPINEDCTWLVMVAEGHSIDMQITDIGIPSGLNCSNGFLAIFDGENETDSQLLTRKCDSLPANVSTTGNRAFIRLRGDPQYTGRGFQMSYSTGCGAILTAGEREGVISTFDTSVATYRNCTWTIRAKDLSDRVSLTFTAIDAPPEVGWSCTRNNVAVYEGENYNGTLIKRICNNQLPPTITSRGDSLTITASSTWHSRVVKFRAIYHQTSTACGGELEAMAGSFASPEYPDSYPLNIECVWILKASVGNKLSLSLSSFSLEQSDFCNGDYLEIRESDATGRLFGRICGSDSDNFNLVNMTAANRLWIKFRSDGEGTAAGFVANFNIVPNVQLSGRSGEVSSPLYPRLIHHTLPMSWIITVPENNVVEISFIRMELYRYIYRWRRPVCLSQLQVFDGADEGATSIGTYCDPTLPDPIKSTQNTIRVTFANRGDSYGSGFHIRWNAAVTTSRPVDQDQEWATGCGGRIFLNDTYPSDVISSPGYPQGYAPNLKCEWIITSPPMTHLRLQWMAMELEDYDGCRADYVQVLTTTTSSFTTATMWTPMGQYCKRDEANRPPNELWTNSMKLRFYSDSWSNRSGFSVLVSSACGGPVSSPNGILRSPSYPSNYPADQNCTWDVTVRPGKTISLQINDFELEGYTPTCQNDFLVLRNGLTFQSPILGDGKYCGSTRPQPFLQTTSNHLYVQFVSNGLYAYKGFELEFGEVSAECGGVYMLNAGDKVTIQSPNYPSSYPMNTRCEWRVVGPISKRLRMDFEDNFDIPFQQNCENDYVRAYDGGTEHSEQLGQFCGTDKPPTIWSTSNALFIVFYSQDHHPSRGFRAKVTNGECGGTVISETGTISSPNYPHGYSAVTCEWIIIGPSGHFFILNFIDLQTSRRNYINCTQADTVQIRDSNSTDTLLGEFCGQNTTTVVRSAENRVYVRFRALSPSPLPGFVLHFNISAEECGGELSTPNGVIVSPHYPRSYPRHRRCQWTIRAPEGRKVRLQFTHFDLEDTEGRCMDRVTTGNSPYRGYSILPPYYMCGTTLPPVIMSSSNYMKVTFYSDGAVTGTGFRAIYDTELEWDCGGELSPESGTIASPGYDNGNYSHNLLCQWSINNPNPNASYIIQINHLSLENAATSVCPYDSLDIRGGTDRNGPTLISLCGNITSPVLYAVPYSQLFIVLETDQTIAHVGFNLSYTAADCGREVGAAGGIIQSPSYPSNYGNNVHCAWTIQLEEGQQALIDFDDFQLENSQNCASDYVLVRNGLNLGAPIIGRYCGSNSSLEITTQGHLATIEFHTNDAIVAKGFKIIVTAVTHGCSGIYHSETGQLSSVHFPNDYPANIECEWLLEGDSGFFFNVSFVERFDIENQINCTNDFVEAFDYYHSGWVSMGRKCGAIFPTPYLSQTNRMRLVFRSNNAISGDGFRVNWTQSCGGSFDAKTEGSFTSPGYPVAYRNSLSCYYLITPPVGHYLVLSFDDLFELEAESQCKFDSVTVYGGNSTDNPVLRGPTCGTTPPATVSRLGPLLVHFRTDISVMRSGFRANYKTTECGGILTGSSGEISSPTRPDVYHSNMECTWLIIGVPNKIIEIKFQEIEIEGYGSDCPYDYVRIHNGNSTSDANLIGKFCGRTIPPVTRSTGSNVTLSFITDDSYELKGFRLLYRSTYGVAQGCGGSFNASSGTIESLDTDRNGEYESGLNCEWTISVGLLQSIQLTFSRFDIEKPDNRPDCPWDYIEIRDGISPSSMLIGHYCGTQAPPSITSSGSQLFIRFVSDGSYNKAGFTLNYQTVSLPCGGIINTTSVIQSPNYPQNYPINQRCRWLVVNPAGSAIYITFEDFKLESSPGCQKDYLSLNFLYGVNDAIETHSDNGLDSFPGYFHKYCGPTPPPSIEGGSSLLINFASDGDGTAKGFRLHYTSPPCNHSHTAPHDVISASFHSNTADETKTCIRTITAAPGWTISLYFNNFGITNTSNCQQHYLEIRDGGNETSRLLGKWCDYSLPNPVFSSGNQLWLKLHMSAAGDGRPWRSGGYRAQYTTTNRGSGCGGRLVSEHGYMTSPGYPSNHPVSDVCLWHISVPYNQNINIRFQQFDIGPSDNCTANNLKIFNGDVDDDDNLLITLCGGDHVAEYDGTGNSIVVKYVTSVNNIGTGFKFYFTSVYNYVNPFGEPMVPQLEKNTPPT